MRQATQQILITAAQAKLESGKDDLSVHVGHIYDLWSLNFAMNRFEAGQEGLETLSHIEAVRAELAALGFSW